VTRRQFAMGAAALPLGTLAPAQTPKRDFFYKPVDAWAADFIPFYWEGTFYLFYLLDWRDKVKHGEGTPWYLVTTRDFVNFTEHGEMLPRGAKEDQDLWVFTGSVVRGEGKFHIYYTGHNSYVKEKGGPQEAIMHAVSDDLLTWRKVPGEKHFAPPDRYERDDWRDSFVFWNDEAKEYWMLLAARLKTGPSRRRGCTALATSKDLKTWAVQEPFWTPGLYFTHECPDLFRMGDWWYLVYSTFTERSVTHYRMSRSLKGPWLAPENDTFDGRAFYAAKTAGDGNRRFVFGWNPTRNDAKDYKPWNWGGNLVVHQVIQAGDGTLSVRPPASVLDAFSEPVEIKSGQTKLSAPDSFAVSAAGVMPSRCRIDATIDFDAHTRGCGLMLRMSEDADTGYYVRLEPRRNRLVFDSWPRSGDNPFMVELERPISLPAGQPVHLTLLADNSVFTVYANNQVAMSGRMYDHASGAWGVFVNEGTASFGGLSCKQPSNK
jgi:beta-fructofuranosidase